jgi:hypothetical protein
MTPTHSRPVRGGGECQIVLARRIAIICGPRSAAAQAVEDYERREAEGQEPVCITHGGSWLVMPRTTFESAAR